MKPDDLALLRADVATMGDLGRMDHAEPEQIDAAKRLLERAFDNARALLAAHGRLAAVEGALREAVIWHEAQDKALSKQPPSGDGGWRRMEHQEQAALLRAALSPTAKEAGDGE